MFLFEAAQRSLTLDAVANELGQIGAGFGPALAEGVHDVARLSRQAEIAYLCGAVLVDEHVGRLEVPVDHTRCVQKV